MLLDKSAQKIQRMFDSVAPKYDFLNHFLSLGVDCRWRRKTARIVLDSISELPAAPILDVCCGTGDLCFAFERLSGNCGERQIYGIDFSDKMLEIAKQKSHRKNSRAAFHLGDAMNLPFEDNTFAAVSNAFGLRNTADTQHSLSEMFRVCRKGGTVAVLEFSVPVLPVFSQIYRFYFRSVLPFIGKMFSKNEDGAYKYLPESVLTFDEPAELRQKMKCLGLTEVKSVSMTFGIAVLTMGRKTFSPATCCRRQGTSCGVFAENLPKER